MDRLFQMTWHILYYVIINPNLSYIRMEFIIIVKLDQIVQLSLKC